MKIKGFKGKKSIAITVLAVLIIAALGAASYFIFLNKPPRDYYLQTESKNFRKYSEHIKRTYKDFYSYQKPYLDSRYKNRVELTADIKSDGDKPFGLENSRNIFDIVKRCKLIVDSSTDPAAKESLTRLSLSLENAPLIDATAYLKDKVLGFTVPVLLPDKYFTVNTDRMDEVYSRFDIPFRPKKAVKMSDIAKTVSYSDSEFDKVIKDYGAFISGLIEEKDVRYGRNVTLRVGNEKIKARQIEVTLGSDKTKKLVQTLLDKAASDDTLIKLTYGNYADVIGLFDEAGLFQVINALDSTGYLKLNDSEKALVNGLNVKKDISAFKGIIRELSSKANFDGGLKMIVTVDGAGNILDRRVSANVSSGPQAKANIEIHTGSNDVKNDDFRNGFCSLRINRKGESGDQLTQVWNISSNITPAAKNGDKKGKVEAGYSESVNNQEKYAFQAKFDLSKNTDETTMKTNNKIVYNIQTTEGKSDVTGKFSGELITESWKNNKQKTRNANSTFTVNADMPSLGLKNTSLKLRIASEDKFGINFKLPEVQAANAIDLNTISDADLAKVEEQIMASFGTFYLKNKPIFDAVSGQ